MTCAEFQELVWAYALDALEPQERAAAERHLSSEGPHQGCESALDEAYRTAASLSATVQPTRPDRGLWQAIERRLQPPREHRRTARQWPAWAIAAAALLLCSAAILRGMSLRESLIKANHQLAQAGSVQNELKRCADELSAMRQSSDLQRSALALLELPTTRLVPLGPPAPGAGASRGSALLNLEQRKAVVLVSALEPQVGKDYELWLIRGDAKIAAGLLHPGAGGRTIAQVDPNLLAPGRPDAIAVTLEPAGGGDQPKGPIVLVGTVSKT
jgi:anti-sigma-K factor RskA